jgi:hypothetical protein
MPGGFHQAAEEIFARLAAFKGAPAVELEEALQKLTETSKVATDAGPEK